VLVSEHVVSLILLQTKKVDTQCLYLQPAIKSIQVIASTFFSHAHIDIIHNNCDQFKPDGINLEIPNYMVASAATSVCLPNVVTQAFHICPELIVGLCGNL
jgi:hypothetical protein